MEERMTVKRTRWVFAALAVLVGLVATGCGSVDKAKTSDAGGQGGTLKLGLQIPLNGPYQTIGTTMKQAVQLYLREHGNKLGGRTVQLDVQDEGATAAAGQSGMRRLISDGVQAVTGVVNPTTTQAVAPVAKQAGLPVVSLTNTEVPDTTWWTVSYGLAGEYASYAQYLAKHYRTMYGISGDTTPGHLVLGGMVKAYEAFGGRFLGTAYSPYGTTDFQPYLSKAKASGAQAVFAWYAGAEAISFVKQWGQFGLGSSAQLYGISLTQEPLLAAEGDAAKQVRVQNTYAPSLDVPGNAEFVKAYNTAYRVNPDEFGEWQWSAMVVLDDALSSIKGDASPAAIARAVAALSWIDSPRGRWRFGWQNLPDQHYYITQPAQNAQGVLENKVIYDLGFWTSRGTQVTPGP
jgi:branched-chain amino acid transport system substrate-binding protein